MARAYILYTKDIMVKEDVMHSPLYMTMRKEGGDNMTEMEFHQETVALDEEAKALVIIDQTKLPGRIEMLSLTKVEDVWEAIYQLKVRGAPAIGVAAAIGIYVAAVRFGNDEIGRASCRERV